MTRRLGIFGVFARYKDGDVVKRGVVCLENWNGTTTGIEKLQVNGTVPSLAWHEEEERGGGGEEEDKKIEAHWRVLFSYLEVGGRFIWDGQVSQFYHRLIGINLGDLDFEILRGSRLCCA